MGLQRRFIISSLLLLIVASTSDTTPSSTDKEPEVLSTASSKSGNIASNSEHRDTKQLIEKSSDNPVNGATEKLISNSKDITKAATTGDGQRNQIPLIYSPLQTNNANDFGQELEYLMVPEGDVVVVQMAADGFLVGGKNIPLPPSESADKLPTKQEVQSQQPKLQPQSHQNKQKDPERQTPQPPQQKPKTQSHTVPQLQRESQQPSPQKESLPKTQPFLVMVPLPQAVDGVSAQSKASTPSQTVPKIHTVQQLQGETQQPSLQEELVMSPLPQAVNGGSARSKAKTQSQTVPKPDTLTPIQQEPQQLSPQKKLRPQSQPVPVMVPLPQAVEGGSSRSSGKRGAHPAPTKLTKHRGSVKAGTPRPTTTGNKKRSPLLMRLLEEAVAADSRLLHRQPPRGFTLPAHELNVLVADSQDNAAEAGGEQYEFSYAVRDGEKGADFGHSETRSGGRTSGRYWQTLPDGRRQAVTYWADGKRGYHAEVQYSEHP